MVNLSELLVQIKNQWSTPKIAIHRGVEIPLKLSCSLNLGADQRKLSSLKENLPREVRAFFEMTDGAILFKDDLFGQWGLKLYSLDEIHDATKPYLDGRVRDSLEGDLIIGEFIGDSDLLLLRCNPESDDYGYILVVSAIDPRADWDVVATDLFTFLRELYSHQGDKYWELQRANSVI